MKKITLITFLLSTLAGYTQIEATTNDGRTAILKEDMTYEWKNEEKSEVDSNEVVFATPKTELPAFECNFSTNEVDEFTGTSKKVVNDELLISYTSDELKKYFKNRDYLTCHVYCGKIDDTKVLYTYWKIQSKDAYKYFGSIRKGSKLMFKLTNGELVELKFYKYNSGDLNYDGGYTTYSSYLLIEDEMGKKLLDYDIEKVRMYWSEGYEDYEVKDAQVLRRQLTCLSE